MHGFASISGGAAKNIDSMRVLRWEGGIEGRLEERESFDFEVFLEKEAWKNYVLFFFFERKRKERDAIRIHEMGSFL